MTVAMAMVMMKGRYVNTEQSVSDRFLVYGQIFGSF